jgi:putative ABC transport system permease protein
VGEGYPLRGQLEISDVPFTMDEAQIDAVSFIPKPGELWVDSRLLPSIKIQLGGKLAVGEAEFTVTKVLIRQPESGGLMGAMAPRIVMNLADVPATQVVQEGSNVRYLWLLASDDDAAREKFIAELKPKLSKHERIIDITTSQERLANTLDTGRNFLVFAAVIAVVLAGVAIAIAARRFSERHTNQVALMKSLGTSAARIRRLYIGQLLLLGIAASLVGLLIGYGLQELVAAGLRTQYQLNLLPPKFYPFALSLISALICLLCFALPALWFLPGIPPLKILRREMAVKSAHIGWQATLALLAVIAVVGLFSANLQLTLSLSGALAAVILAALLVGFLLLRLSKRLVLRAGGIWRLAFSSLQHRQGQSLVQMLVFAIAIMLLLTLTIVRTSLIDDWKKQLPDHAPNHFLVNIPPSEVSEVQRLLEERKLLDSPLYPMIRGRLVQINGIEPDEAQTEKANALQREVNLTQSQTFGSDNKLVEGEWWDGWTPGDLAGVSVEQGTAKDLGLKLGDKLKFSLGGLMLDAEVTSIRSVEWKSMKPNFFFIFSPGALDAYSPTYMTSIYLAAEQKMFLSDLLRAHPTMLVMEFDRVIEQMRSIINQVSDGIQLVLWFTLAAGALVLLSAVMSSIDSRQQEAGLLRALGSPQKLILGSVFAEFLILGILSGTIAILGAEVLLISLQKFVLRTPIQPHYLYWLLSPLGSAALISALGVLCCRRVVTTPPAVVLREAA